MLKLNVTEQEWTLREYLLVLLQRWHMIALSVFLGGLAAMLISTVLPGKYIAIARLTVVINMDGEYKNPDDYKNSLIRQLETFILSEDIIEKSFERLRNNNPQWSEFDLSEYSELLSTSWRDAGYWNLRVNSSNEMMASEAIEIWQDVIFSELDSMQPDLDSLSQIDRRLFRATNNLVEAIQHERFLELLSSKIKFALQNLSTLPDDEIIEMQQRNLILEIVSDLEPVFVNSRSPSSNKLDILEPSGEEEPISYYINWLTLLHETISYERESSRLTTESLGEHQLIIAKQRSELAQNFNGISVNLHLQPASQSNITIIPVRPKGLMTLFGGLVGLILYLTYQLYKFPSKSTVE